MKFRNIQQFFIFVFCILSQGTTSAEDLKIPVVTILVDDAYPPYTYTINNELRGIYVEIVRLAAKSLSTEYKLELIPMPWKRALLETKLGNALGILPPYKHLTARPFIFPYSKPLMTEHVIAFCNKNININPYLNGESIKPKLNIGINAGFLILGDKLTYAKKIGTVKVWENKNTQANIFKLISNRIDCYLNDKLSTLWQFQKMKTQNSSLNFNDIKESYLIMSQNAYIGYAKNYIKLSSKNDFIKQMDLALDKLKTSGEMELVINRYIK
jgi:polar amino acid transport system substrate-binding protein